MLAEHEWSLRCLEDDPWLPTPPFSPDPSVELSQESTFSGKSNTFEEYEPEACQNCHLLQRSLLHDCMWTSVSFGGQAEGLDDCTLDPDPCPVLTSAMSDLFDTHVDHTYYRPSSAAVPSILGTQTPSDTDDEVDIITVSPEASSERPFQSSQQRWRKVKCAPPSSRKRQRRGSKQAMVETAKRDLHNTLERQRRVDLRQCFEVLKRRVPYFSLSQKASKVAILRQATAHCLNLAMQRDSLRQQKVSLLYRNRRLRIQLNRLIKAEPE